MNTCASDMLPYTRFNRPGLTRLFYRAGTYTSVLQRLEDTIIDLQSHLPLLNKSASNSWVLSLLESWALVIDVLTFYQERIANEGYLRTAVEPLSILDLVSAIGYQPSPGVGAGTYLAFQVRQTPQQYAETLSRTTELIAGNAARNQRIASIPDSIFANIAAGQPSQQYSFTQGIAVQSVPTRGQQVISFSKPPEPDQLPRVFETSSPFDARPEWNAIKPAKAADIAAQNIWTSTTSLHLDGTQTHLKESDVLLIVGDPSSPQDRARPWLFATLSKVEPNPQRGCTLVTWDESVQVSQPNTLLQTPQVFALRQQGKLFSYTQGGAYYTRTDGETANWFPVSIGLPNAAINTLLRHKTTGNLFVGTDSGVFRSSNNGESWEAASSGLMKMKIAALTASPDGTLYAGSTTGNVFSSDDNGNNWRRVLSQSVRRRGVLALLLGSRSKDNSLPKTVIRALTTYTENGKHHLVAATDEGVFYSTDDGINWGPLSLDTSITGIPPVEGALSLATPNEEQKLLVGMKNGVYPPAVKNWHTAGLIAAIIAVIVALLLFVLGQMTDPNNINLLTPLLTSLLHLPQNTPWLVNFIFQYQTIYAYHLGSLLSIFYIDAFLILVFVIVGQRPLIQAATGRFSIVIQNWHTWRNIAIFSVIIATIPTVLAALGDSEPKEAEKVKVSFFGFDISFYHPYLDLFLTIFFTVAILFAIFLLIWWFIRHNRALGLLPTTPVRALAFRGNDNVLAGTEEGIFRSQDNAQNWARLQQRLLRRLFSVPIDEHLRLEDLNERKIPDGLRNEFTSNKISLGQDVELAVTNPGPGWTLTDTNNSVTYVLMQDSNNIQVYRTSTGILSFESSSQQYIFAGTQDGGVFRASDNGDAWNDYANNLPLADVRVMLGIPPNGLIAAGLPGSTDINGQWSYFHIQEQKLDLDKTYAKLSRDGWVVLQREGQNPQVALCQSISVTTTVCEDFKKSKDFTSIRVHTTDNLASFDRRTTSVYLQSDPLALFGNDPILDGNIIFDGLVPGLKADQNLIVSGKPSRVRLPNYTAENSTPAGLFSPDGSPLPFTKDDSFQLQAPAAPVDDAPGRFKWQLRAKNGQICYFIGSKDAVSYEMANDDDEDISEMVRLRSDPKVEPTTGKTTVALYNPLNNSSSNSSLLHNVYDRSTVTICANVVYATHGQTVKNEVLGSVDDQKGYSRFALKHSPLTYLPSTNPGEDFQSTLTALQVNMVLWKRVPFFLGRGSSEQVYMERRDSQNNTTIIFGNGQQGAHPPSGREHITATYRYGSGAVGNVPAGSLTMLRTRPPGIQSVTNPIAATGGDDPESKDLARHNGPLSIQNTQRIVSLNDYKYFALTFPGISKAQVKMVWRGRTLRLLLTIAGDDGVVIAQDFCSHLLAAINAIVAPPAQPLTVRPYNLLFFQLKATLVLLPGYESSTIRESIKDKLTSIFSFDMRELDQPVSVSEIIPIIQRVEGVDAIKLASLSIPSLNIQDQPFLPVEQRQAGDDPLQPASLLLLDTGPNAIDLKVE